MLSMGFLYYACTFRCPTSAQVFCNFFYKLIKSYLIMRNYLFMHSASLK